VEFNPTAKPGSPDYGLLYTSGSDLGFSNGGGPNSQNPGQTQRLDSLITAILRIDPRSPSESKGQKGVGDYTIPPSNRFAADGIRRRWARSTPTASATRIACPGTSPTEPCSRPTSAWITSKR
jgi:hypothetical protein